MKALTAAAVAVVVVVAAVVVIVVAVVVDGTTKVTMVIPGALLEILELELEFLDFRQRSQHSFPGLSLHHQLSASPFSKDGKRKCIWQRSFGAEARWPAAVLPTRMPETNRKQMP